MPTDYSHEIGRSEESSTLYFFPAVFRHDISDSSFQLPADHVELQSRLTLYGYKQLAARALRQADSWEQQRLISLSASHATAWTTGPNPWVSMSSTEYRYGLKWILGVELLEQPTVCTACSMLQDCYGRHAVTCRRSGAIPAVITYFVT